MKIVILGNGISGITAARHIRKLSNHEILVISKETDYFFSRTALMYLYMGHMRYKDIQPYPVEFWSKNRIDLFRAEVTMIDFEQKCLHLNSQFKPNNTELAVPPHQVTYDKLILALGSSPNKFGWPGQDLERVQGLYSFQDLETMEQYSKDVKKAVIVGGGLIGIEMAEMFHSRNIPVSLLVREESYWDMVLPAEESTMVGRHIRKNGIDLRLKTGLKEILGDEKGRAAAVITDANEKINCEFVGLTAGVHPNVKWLKESALEIDRGILVNNKLETNLPNVYAIGDCAQIRDPQPQRRNIEAVWYTGRMMGEVVAHNICSYDVVYDPGIWFNSAKFLDIEYQVYGQVPVEIPDHLDTIYWEDARGEKSIRLVFERITNKIVGFNLMGIRFRHEVCEKWIQEGVEIEKVLQEIALASFDPEFFPHYHLQLIGRYNQKFGKTLTIEKKRRFDRVYQFLKR